MTRFLLALVLLVPAVASAQVSPYPFGAAPPIFGLPTPQGSSTNPFTDVVFTGQALGPVGNCTTAPAYSFTGDTNTGMSSSGADALCFPIGGTSRLNITSSAVSPTVAVRAPDGVTATPSYSFTAETDFGFMRNGTRDLLLVGASTNLMRLGSGGVVLRAADFLSWSATSDAAGATDVVLGRGAANRMDLATGDSLYLVSGGLGVGVVNTTAGNIQASGTVVTGAGTTAIPPLTVTNGTNLTTATANAVEHDGAAIYTTSDTTNGRRYSDAWNYFRLTGSGTGITSIADFFGANSAIPLVASGVYEIEWNAYFSQVTAGTATWTVTTATTALATLTGEYMCSNIAGIGTVGAPQTAAINVTSSSATAFPVTGTEATAVTHYCRVRVMLTAGAGASNTRLRLTMSAGTATPLINSYFRVRRLSAGNTGTFVP